MRLTQEAVLELCRKAGETYQVDPVLLCAICLQESGFVPDEIRLENAFYRRYSRPMNFDPLSESLLAISYGLMQTMGESLRELGFFKSMEPGALASEISAYLKDPAAQVDCGAQWFARKLQIAKGDIQRALCYWNGDMKGRYAAEVLAKRDRIMKIELLKFAGA